MKNIFIIFIVAMLFPASQKERPKISKRQECKMICFAKNLYCAGHIEKLVYDGATEEAKLLKAEEYAVCVPRFDESYKEFSET
jgi:hypothetical protein